MDIINYKKRLVNHIKALENAYKNTIELLNDVIEKDDKGKIKMSSAQRKNYIESVQKSATASNDIMTMIRDKYTELESLNKEVIKVDDSKKKEKTKEETTFEEPPTNRSGSTLNDHLN